MTEQCPTPSGLRRMPPRCIVYCAALALMAAVPVLGVLLGARARFPSVPPWLWSALWCYLGYTRLWRTFAPYLATRYGWDAGSFTLTSGVVSTSRKSLAWSEVTSVRSSQTWLHRLLRCSRLDVVAAGSHGSLTVPVMSRAEALAVEHCFTRSHPDSCSQQPRHAAVLYEISHRGMWITGFTYGQYVLIVPAAAGLLDDLHLIPRLPEVTLQWEALLAGSASAWATLVCLSALGGTAASFVKYSGFCVSADERTLHLQRGLFDKRTTLPKKQIHGFLLRQNVLMQLLGLYRLDACTRSHDHQEMTSTLLPCARPAQIVLFLDALGTRVPSTDLWPPGASLRAVPGGLVHARRRAALVSSAFVLLFVTGYALLRVDVRLAAALATVLVVTANQLHGATRPIAGQWIWVRSRLLSPKFLWAPISDLHRLELMSSPWFDALGVARIRAHVYAGRPLTFSAWCTPAAAARVRARFASAHSSRPNRPRQECAS